MESNPLEEDQKVKAKVTYPKSYNKIKTIYDEKLSTGFCCDFSHLKSTDYRDVYEPSEDSFLLIDALELDIDYIVNEIKPLYIVEIG